MAHVIATFNGREEAERCRDERADVIEGSAYGDYHRPYQITETGDLSRTTTRTFEHHDALPTQYLVGLLETEDVSVGSETFSRSLSYDPATGFVLSETTSPGTNDAIQTTFTPDAQGNVFKMTRTGADGSPKTTTRLYSFGLVKQTTLPNGDLIVLEIDNNSTTGLVAALRARDHQLGIAVSVENVA